MCLILFALDAHPRYPVVVAANRDEFHDRPTARAAEWADAPGVVGGRDLRGGGTWMAAARGGRWAALTNVRSPGFRQDADAPSRGLLVSRYVAGRHEPYAFAARLRAEADRYNGFNLLLGDAGRVVWMSNRSDAPPRALESGIYGISNALLDTPWPKVERGKRALRAALDAGAEPDVEALLELLADQTVPAQSELPDTGVGLEWERALAPALIRTPDYGTRTSTVLLIDRAGAVTLVERAHTEKQTADRTLRLEP